MNLREHRHEGAWFVAALASIVCVPLLAEHAFSLAFVPPAIVLLAGLALVAYWTFSGAGRRAFDFLSVIALAGMIAIQLQEAAAIAFTHLRFKLDRHVLDAIVDREHGNSPHPVRTQRGRYIVEAGAPLRVAFPAPAGITHNWCAIVFDPSHEVMHFSSNLNRNNPELAHVKEFFGGELGSCRQLDVEYFYCCFA